MKNTENEQKKSKAGALKGFLNKVTDIKRGTAEKVHENALAKADKKRTNAYLKQLEKYNPVYEEAYNGNFYMPNLLMIEDDTRRLDSEVLNCAIGWVEKGKNADVFHLFEDCIEKSGLKFLPNVQCGGLYCVDGFDKNTYLKVECIFDIVRDEKLAELKHIAQSLGAKSCAVELVVKESSTSSAVKIIKNAKNEAVIERGASSKRSNKGSIIAEFEGNGVPKKPTLKWFANDKNILNLIETRCSGENPEKTVSVELSGATYATMSRNTACSIDSVIGKMKGTVSMENKVVNESESNLVFVIEF